MRTYTDQWKTWIIPRIIFLLWFVPPLDVSSQYLIRRVSMCHFVLYMPIQPQTSWVCPLAGLCSRGKLVPSTYFLHSMSLVKAYHILYLENGSEQSIPCNSILSKMDLTTSECFELRGFFLTLFFLNCWNNLCMVICYRDLHCSHCHTRKCSWELQRKIRYSLHWHVYNHLIKLLKGIFSFKI